MPNRIGRAGYFLVSTGLILLIPLVLAPLSSVGLQWYDAALFFVGILLAILGVLFANQDPYLKNLGWQKWVFREPFVSWRYRIDRGLLGFGMIILLLNIQAAPYSNPVTSFAFYLLITGLIALLVAWIDILRSQSNLSKEHSNS